MLVIDYTPQRHHSFASNSSITRAGYVAAEIYTVLEDPNLALLPIIDRQIQAIDQRLAETEEIAKSAWTIEISAHQW